MHVMCIYCVFINHKLASIRALLWKQFNISSMTLLKKLFAELAEGRDYMTLNMLQRRNQNVNIFDTRLLNEDIPQTDMHFTECEGKLRNVAKYTNLSKSNSQIQYYEPNSYIQTTPQYPNTTGLDALDLF